ncbi:hypothetical protein CHS0354_032407 [Potamilus streckersoni]|uniref:Uncharacterized protein n=1 Tax=Potamilus streckersoni TaxID=2493646 RepID=A0AAE0VLW5_9BIVA|nr:hypothetical protein CHS0354_032407 [Potamilus streckersoni]
MAQTPTRTMARRSPLRPLQRMSTGRVPNNRLNNNININGLDVSDISDDDTPLNQSFDEQIIQLRGALRSSPRRRSAALATAELSLLGLSPDTSFDTSLESSVSNSSAFSDLNSSTPVREPVLAEGIRKRLMLTPPSDLDTSFPKGSTPPKKRKTKQGSSASWRRRLSALSQDQLVVLVDEITMRHPTLREEVERMMPSPDINPFIDNLEYFRHNIFKSLPQSRLGSNRDAFCFKRVKTHVENFKAACINQGKQLTEAEAWEGSIEYVIRAAELVDKLPDWDNPTHNKIKLQCFKGLLSQGKSALKHSDLDRAKYQSIRDRFQTVVKICVDFDPLLKFVEKKLEKFTK